MNQSTLVEHIDKGPAIRLCPNCFEPITPYWVTVKIDPIPMSPNVLMTHERKCNCGYVEQTTTKDIRSLVCSMDQCTKCSGCS